MRLKVVSVQKAGRLFYSQPRMFYRSQTPIEQAHIASAIVFELSKVETPYIRERMVAQLLTVDETLGKTRC